MTTRIERTVYEVPTAAATPCDSWDGRLVIVERGPVELVSRHGARLTLHTGDMFSTACTGQVTICSTGGAAAVVTTVHRVADPSTEPAPHHPDSVDGPTVDRPHRARLRRRARRWARRDGVATDRLPARLVFALAKRSLDMGTPHRDHRHLVPRSRHRPRRLRPQAPLSAGDRLPFILITCPTAWPTPRLALVMSRRRVRSFGMWRASALREVGGSLAAARSRARLHLVPTQRPWAVGVWGQEKRRGMRRGFWFRPEPVVNNLLLAGGRQIGWRPPSHYFDVVSSGRRLEVFDFGDKILVPSPSP